MDKKNDDIQVLLDDLLKQFNGVGITSAIHWPTGKKQILKNIKSNQILTVTESN